MPAVQEYFATLDEPARAAFERVRALALKLAPDAEEGVSYGMAALRYQKKPLIGFRAAKDHLSVFPFSPEAIDAVREQLDGFELSKGTVRFTVGKPLPDKALRAMLKHRLAQIAGSA
jgi:uncharacterized protein YdhG (YjbR/CyaY superfamily)